MAEHVAFFLVVHAHAVVDNSQVAIEAENAERSELQVHRKHVVRKRELVQRQVVVIARAPVEHVAGKVNANPVVVEREMRTVARIARIFHAGIIFFFLHFQKFVVPRPRLFRGVSFVVNAGVEHELKRIRIAAQVDTAIDTRPYGIAKIIAPAVVYVVDIFPAAVIDTADDTRRNRELRELPRTKGFEILDAGSITLMALQLKPVPGNSSSPQVVVIEQRLSLGIHEALDKRGIAPRVGKELTLVAHSLPVVFEEHRGSLERAQATGAFGPDNRRCGKRLQGNQRQECRREKKRT